ncbi:MAG: hypothetical protein RR627_05670 [Niameybacter sp.]
MDTIIFLLYQHEVYVGDYYKDKMKEVKFEKADSWEVYNYEDLEELLEYMQYPLKYNQFKNNRLIFLFDDIRFYEWLTKAKRLLSQSEYIYAERIEPFIEIENRMLEVKQAVEDKEEEEMVLPVKPVELYERLLAVDWSLHAQAYRYELVLSPSTLYTIKEEGSKQFLQVQDIVDMNTLIKEETYVQKGDEILAYDHCVARWFGRIKVERLSKKVNGAGTFYWHVLKEVGHIFAKKDEVIGVIDHERGTKEEMLAWCEKIL